MLSDRDEIYLSNVSVCQKQEDPDLAQPPLRRLQRSLSKMTNTISIIRWTSRVRCECLRKPFLTNSLDDLIMIIMLEVVGLNVETASAGPQRGRWWCTRHKHAGEADSSRDENRKDDGSSKHTFLFSSRCPVKLLCADFMCKLVDCYCVGERWFNYNTSEQNPPQIHPLYAQECRLLQTSAFPVCDKLKHN